MTGYGWWATSTHPFTFVAYVAVAIPVLICAGFLTRRHSPTVPDPAASAERESALTRLWPWLLLALVAVALESTGLALGGRSRDFPTLSTVIDQALVSHVVRWLLFCLWLGVGAWFVRPAAHWRASRRSREAG